MSHLGNELVSSLQDAHKNDMVHGSSFGFSPYSFVVSCTLLYIAFLTYAFVCYRFTVRDDKTQKQVLQGCQSPSRM